MADLNISYESRSLQQILNIMEASYKKLVNGLKAVQEAYTTITRDPTAGGALSGGEAATIKADIQKTYEVFDSVYKGMGKFIVDVDEAKKELEKDSDKTEDVISQNEIERFREGENITIEGMAKDFLDGLAKAAGDPDVFNRVGDYTHTQYLDRLDNGEIGWFEANLGRAGTMFGNSVMTTLDVAVNLPGLVGEVIGVKSGSSFDIPTKMTYGVSQTSGNLGAWVGKAIDRGIETVSSWWNSSGPKTVEGLGTGRPF